MGGDTKLFRTQECTILAAVLTDYAVDPGMGPGEGPDGGAALGVVPDGQLGEVADVEQALVDGAHVRRRGVPSGGLYNVRTRLQAITQPILVPLVPHKRLRHLW